MNKENIKKSAIYEYIAKETGVKKESIKAVFSRKDFDINDSNQVTNYIIKNKFKYQYEGAGIYSIINKKTKREYIGMTYNLKKRSVEHILNLQKGRHINKDLQADYNKYGSNNFEFIVLRKIIGKDIRIKLFIAEYEEILSRKNIYNKQIPVLQNKI